MSKSFRLSSEPTHPVTKIIAFTLLALVLLVCLMPGAPAPTPEETAASAARQQRKQQAYAGVLALKSAMRNPDRFVLEYAGVSESGAATCIEYRAQNGFGGMNRESAVIGGNFAYTSGDGSGKFVRAWNRNCTSTYNLTEFVRSRL